MKQQLISTLATIAIIFLAACTKMHDPGFFQNQHLKFCPILKLESFDPANPGAIPTKFTIDYNAKGNPVDMLFVSGNTPDKVDYHFRYDRSDRPTDYIINYAGSTGALIWHTYTYPEKDIILDSQFNYGGSLITDARPDPANFARYYIYSLDKLGRVIKSEQPHPGSSSYIINYAYDSRGNMIREGVEYDDKINPYQTNALWKFLFKDYSVNNPSKSVFESYPVTYPEYNSLGLPLVIRGVVGGYEGLFLFDHGFYLELHIEYACDGVQKGL